MQQEQNTTVVQPSLAERKAHQGALDHLWAALAVLIATHLVLSPLFKKEDNSFEARLARELGSGFAGDFDKGEQCNHSSQLQVYRKIVEDKSAPTEFRIKINGVEFEVLPYIEQLPAEMMLLTPKGMSYTAFFQCGFTVSFFACGKLVTLHDAVAVSYLSASSDTADKGGDSLKYQPLPSEIEDAYFGSDSAISFKDVSPGLQALLNHAYHKVLDSAESQLRLKLPGQPEAPKQPPQMKEGKKKKQGGANGGAQAIMENAAAKRVSAAMAAKLPDARRRQIQLAQKRC